MGDRLGIPSVVGFIFQYFIRFKYLYIKDLIITLAVAYDYTTLTTPDLVRSRKLSSVVLI